MTGPPLDRAVAPNLFDVVAEPRLVFTLILANLMSPRLWELGERVAEGGDQAIRHMLDHHFEHVTPARVAEMNGVLDLDALAGRYGAAEVDYAVSRIVSTFEWRVAKGTRDRHTLGLDLIEAGKFPAYTYATIDEAWACRRLLRRHKHKPWGLTCCLDEAAIFAALHLALAKGSPDDVAILGAPTHYSVLACSPDRPCWFHTKQELHSPATWSRLVADSYGGNVQSAFDERLPTFDRIITASGVYWLGTGQSSIPHGSLATILSRIDRFFGGRLAQLEQALQHPVRLVEEAGAAGLVKEASSASGATEARERVRRAAFGEGNVAAQRALYAYRALDVPDPSVYLRAARLGSQLGNLLPAVTSADDALSAVASITGTESIFEDADRIAMPDETVRFATGSVRDKALLLHVLLERSCAGLETAICEADSFVRGADFCLSLSRLARVATPEGRVLYRLAGPSVGR
jgi:hypothetical protein